MYKVKNTPGQKFVGQKRGHVWGKSTYYMYCMYYDVILINELR